MPKKPQSPKASTFKTVDEESDKLVSVPEIAVLIGKTKDQVDRYRRVYPSFPEQKDQRGMAFLYSWHEVQQFFKQLEAQNSGRNFNQIDEIAALLFITRPAINTKKQARA